MLDALKKLFGIGPAVDYGQLMEEGAMIVDVRTKGEYAGGHVKGSLNVPLDQIHAFAKKVKDKNQPILTCCASGMRSGSAKGILKDAGFTNVHNAGPWTNLRGYGK